MQDDLALNEYNDILKDEIKHGRWDQRKKMKDALDSLCKARGYKNYKTDKESASASKALRKIEDLRKLKRWTRSFELFYTDMPLHYRWEKSAKR